MSVKHLEQPKDKWLRFFIGLIFPPYFLYMLVKLYNTHSFNGPKTEHIKFKWKFFSLIYVVTFLLSLVLDLFLFNILVIKIKGLFNPSNQININSLYGNVLTLVFTLITVVILIVIIKLINVFLFSILTARVVFSHEIYYNKIEHKYCPDDYIIILILVLLLSMFIKFLFFINIIVYVYMLYKVSECYSFHEFE